MRADGGGKLTGAHDAFKIAGVANGKLHLYWPRWVLRTDQQLVPLARRKVHEASGSDLPFAIAATLGEAACFKRPANLLDGFSVPDLAYGLSGDVSSGVRPVM